MNPSLRTLLSLGSLLLAAGCGSASDPLLSLGTNANPSLGYPSTSVTAVTGFTASTPFYTMSTATAVVAPALSLVLDVTTTSVTLRHSSRITSTISGMNTVSARPGDYVIQGASLGTTLGTLQWQILENGTAVCPLSFLSSAARSQVAVVNPCAS